MSTDRELLEMAAKAGKYEIVAWENCCGVQVAILSDLSRWQPLLKNVATDCMGDALRLLGVMPSLWTLSLKFGAPTVEMNVAWGAGGEQTDKIAREFAGDGADVAAAICRAIVRAAAEIGRAMP